VAINPNILHALKGLGIGLPIGVSIPLIAQLVRNKEKEFSAPEHFASIPILPSAGLARPAVNIDQEKRAGILDFIKNTPVATAAGAAAGAFGGLRIGDAVADEAQHSSLDAEISKREQRLNDLLLTEQYMSATGGMPSNLGDIRKAASAKLNKEAAAGVPTIGSIVKGVADWGANNLRGFAPVIAGGAAAGGLYGALQGYDAGVSSDPKRVRINQIKESLKERLAGAPVTIKLTSPLVATNPISSGIAPGIRPTTGRDVLTGI